MKTNVVLQNEQQATKVPSRYNVLLMNDDYTPMDFVILVVQMFFSKSFEEAVNLMMVVHTAGKAVCGVYTQDIGYTLASEVNAFAQKHQHPLLCLVERA